MDEMVKCIVNLQGINKNKKQMKNFLSLTKDIKKNC